ncbi:MAG: hypothetical protein LBT56_00115 [Prevotellaceae bacterium]|nr:hypothetical protein [Prevotellaceae bacterium]
MVNNAYYGSDDTPVCNLADETFAFTPEIIAKALKNIYEKNFDCQTEIEDNIFKATLDTFNLATAEGLQQSTRVPERDFIDAIKYNNAVFSAFRTHRMQNDMVKQLTDENGNLKSFSQFAKDTENIRSHYVKSWLKTEYNTAVIRAHQAADWQQYEAEKNILPNLEWMPSTSVTPGEDHIGFWGTILPVNDTFWNSHKPGDRWNCKCYLQANDKNTKPPVLDVLKNPKNKPLPGLENNPGKDAKLFSSKNAYQTKAYSGAKEAVANLIKTLKENTEKREQPPAVETYKKINKLVYQSPYHGKGELKDNTQIANFVSKKIKDKVFLLPNLNPVVPAENILRNELLPRGVPNGKNSDFIIQGKLFEGKNMLGVKDKPDKQMKETIKKRIKEAKKQADNIILVMPSHVKRSLINSTIKNQLKASKTKREIWVIWKNKLLKYNNY